MYPLIIELISPKTDWDARTFRAYTDHQRIAANFDILKQNINNIHETAISMIPNELNSETDIPFVYRINQLETNLYTCWLTIGYMPYAKVIWAAYNAPTFEDFNRWERWQIEILNTIKLNANNIIRCGVPGTSQSRMWQKRWRVLHPTEYPVYAPALQSGMICGADMIRQTGFRA